MAITDPAAIKFSNEQFRPAADRLARCYYRSKELLDAWAALTGTNDEKFALLAGKVERVGTLLKNTRRFIFNSDRIWNSGNVVNLFPNDAAEEIHDDPDGGQQDPNRPPLTGQDVRRLKWRMEEFVNWLDRGTDVDPHFETDTNALLPITFANLEWAFKCSNESAVATVTNSARILATTRCGELIAELEASSNQNLNQILRAAVNPQADS